MAKPFKITFCGDTSLGYYYLEKGKNKYPEAYERLQNDPFSFFEGVAPLLEGSDEVIVNLETVLSHFPGEPIQGKEYPGCDDPDATLEVLERLGATAVTLANNHAMDFGPAPMMAMIAMLETRGVSIIGAGKNEEAASSPYIISKEKSGLSKNIYIFNAMRAGKRYREYGFFASANSPGTAKARAADLGPRISAVKKEDPEALVIVCPHWQGLDYKDIGEKVQEVARSYVDSGADYVVAHGTHKADSVEEYKNGKIFYSIGNFVFNSPGRYKSMGAEPESMVVSIVIDEQGRATDEAERIYTDNRATGFLTVPVSDIARLNTVEQHGSLSAGENIQEEKSAGNMPGSLKDDIFLLNEEELENAAKELPGEQVPAVLEGTGQLAAEVEKKLYAYYKGLFKNKVLKPNSGNEELVALAAATINKRSVDYQMQRKFFKRKEVVKDVVSFHDLILESRSARLLGCRDYGAMLDKKDVAYRFADEVGVRRPALYQVCKFSEIKKPEHPVVIKPTKATGSMGVYLYYSADKILSAREGKWLASWGELVDDLGSKIAADGKRERKYFAKDEWMVEELVTSGDPENPVASDIKIYAFYGEVLLVLETNPALKKYCFWDKDLNAVDTGQYADKSYIGEGISKDQLAIGYEMSKMVPAPYMRFDMLKGKDELVFCEATFYPGNFHAFNEEWDYKLGEAYIKAKGRILEDLLNGKDFKEFKKSVDKKFG